MATDKEEVVYQYTGDVNSLRGATQEAINLLDKYGKAMNKMASMDTFKASKTSTAGFQKTVTGLIKQVNSLTTALNAAGSSIEQAMPDGAATVQAATRDLADVLSYLNTSTSYTSEDMKFLTEVLKGPRASMDALVSRASLLTESLKALAQIKTAESIKQVGDAAKQSANNISPYTRQIIEAREMYQQCGKSAEESALSILKFESASTKISSVDSLIKKLSTEMQILGIMSKRAWSNFAAQMKPLTARLQSFKSKASESFGRFNTVAATALSSLRRTVQTSNDASNSTDTLSSKMQKLSEIFKKNNSTLASSNKHFALFGKIAKTLKSALASLVGVNISKWLTDAVKLSIDYIENLNLFTVAMGDCVEEGTAFVNKMSELYGLDPSNLLRYAGNFYQLADAISMPDQAASNLSLGLTKAAVDISSLFNVDVETVFEDLSSGMQGMSRAVRKYGMDIRATTLQQTALSLGITESTDSMSEANLQGLRFITMMRQAANASSDFSKTIEEPANQLRIFKEQMSQLGRSIGNLFIGPIGKAIQYINGFVMALRMAIDFIASMFGVLNTTESSTEALDNASENIDNIGTSADKTTKALKAMLAPFDELNVLQSSTDSDNALGGIGTLDPSIEAEISNMQWNLEDVSMKAKAIRDELLSFFGFKIDLNEIISWDPVQFESNLINKFPKWSQTIQAVFSNWSAIVNSFGKVLSAIGDVAEKMWERVSGIFGLIVTDESLASSIQSWSSALDSFSSSISTNSGFIADLILVLLGLVAAFKGVSVIYTVIAPIVEFASACSAALSPIGAVIGALTAVAGTIALLYINSEDFAFAFRELLGTVTSSISNICRSLLSLIQTIGSELLRMWHTYIQPVIHNLGNALAPVLIKMGTLFSMVSEMIQDLVEILERSWKEDVEPVVKAASKAINSIIDIFTILWDNCLSPIIDKISKGLKHMWDQYVSPILSKISSVTSGIMELLLNLWNTVLAPIVAYLSNTLGPIITGVVNSIWTVVEFVISLVLNAIDSVLGQLDAFLEFFNGVLTGDLDRALKGLGNMFINMGNTIIGMFESVANLGVNAINTMLETMIGSVKGFVNGVGGFLSSVINFFGGEVDLSVNWTAPQIERITLDRIPTLASGGIVNSGQLFMARENGIPELVGNFGGSTGVMNNQQIVEAVAQGVYEAVMSALEEANGNNTPETIVECDGETLFKIVVGRNKRAILRTGINPLGGEA